MFLGSASGSPTGTRSRRRRSSSRTRPALSSATSVASAGDVNGDGYGDVIVGARLRRRPDRRGRGVRVPGQRRGHRDGTPRPRTRSSSPTRRVRISGTSVASAGDVNGDGYGDVIVGAPALRRGPDRRGRGVRVPRAAPPASRRQSRDAQRRGSRRSGERAARHQRRLGRRRERRRLRRRDRRARLTTRARPTRARRSCSSAARPGSPTADPPTRDAQLESDQAGAQLGLERRLGRRRERRRLRRRDRGRPPLRRGQTDEGAAFVFLGSAAGIATASPRRPRRSSSRIRSSANARPRASPRRGDVNGDGYADVIVGRLPYDAGSPTRAWPSCSSGGAAGIADGRPATALVAARGGSGRARFSAAASRRPAT